jgi:hypothetical protein
MADPGGRLEVAAKFVQVMSVIVGVVISVLSFSAARRADAQVRDKEAEARLLELRRYYDQRTDELRKQQAEAARPFLALRQQRYAEVVEAAAVLANAGDHSPADLAKAKKRFRQLYVAELSLVEAQGVEQAMIDLATAVDPPLTRFTPAQNSAYRLAHALRDSLVRSWNVPEGVVDNPRVPR